MPDDTNTETQTPQVAPGAGLPEAATPEGAGAGVGGAVAQASMVGVRVQWDEQRAAQQQEDHRNHVLALAGSTDVESYDLTGLHGKDGLFSKDPGSNAQQAGNDYLDRRAQYAAKVRQGLPPAAQEAFDLHERERGIETQRQVLEWQDRSDKAFDQKVVAAKLTNTANAAFQAVNETDPGQRSLAVNRALAEGSMTIIDQAKRQGLDFSKSDDAQVIQQRLDSYTSSIVGEVMNGLADKGDMASARVFFDEHKDDLTAKDRLHVERVMAAGDVEDRGLALARSVFTAAPATDGNGAPVAPNREAALAKLDAMNITNAKLYDAARRQVDVHFDQANKAHAESQSALLQQGTDALEDPTNATLAIPPSILNGLDLAHQRALTRYQGELVKAREPKTDPDVWKDITDRLRSPEMMKAATTPGSPLYVDMGLHKADLSPQDWKRLSSEFDTTKAKVAASDQRLSAGTVQKEIVDNLFAQHGMDQKVKPGSAEEQAQKQQQAAFSLQLERAVGARQLGVQRPLTKEEIQEEADKLFTQQTWQRTPQGMWERFTHQSGGRDQRGRTIAPQNVTVTDDAYKAPWAKDLVYDDSQIPAEMLKSMIQSEQRAGITKTSSARVSQYNDLVRARYQASLP